MVTKRFLRKAIADEKKGAREYRKHGFPSLAKDECKHKRILIRKLNSLKRKRK